MKLKVLGILAVLVTFAAIAIVAVKIRSKERPQPAQKDSTPPVMEPQKPLGILNPEVQYSYPPPPPPPAINEEQSNKAFLRNSVANQLNTYRQAVERGLPMSQRNLLASLKRHKDL